MSARKGTLGSFRASHGAVPRGRRPASGASALRSRPERSQRCAPCCRPGPEYSARDGKAGPCFAGRKSGTASPRNNRRVAGRRPSPEKRPFDGMPPWPTWSSERRRRSSFGRPLQFAMPRPRTSTCTVRGAPEPSWPVPRYDTTLGSGVHDGRFYTNES